MVRIILAAVIGGILMFAWGFVSHEVLPLGKVGIKDMPSQATVVPVLSSAISEPGFYTFTPVKSSSADEKPLGPTGVLIYQPNGARVVTPRKLCLEFISNVLAAFFAAAIASGLAGSIMVRAALMMFIGIIGWLSISVSYWVWDEFPTDFTKAEGIMQLACWLLSGIAIATIVKPAAYRVTAA